MAGISLLLATAVSGPALAATSNKTVNASAALKTLVNQTQSLPKAAASKTAKTRLLRAARRARAAAAKSPCTAVRNLTTYRKTLKSTKIRASAKGKRNRARLRKRLAALGPASIKASRRLLSDKRTKTCGGGVVVPTAKTPTTKVMSSDESGIKLSVELPAVQFVDKFEGGKAWTKLVLPNTDSAGAPGAPGVPVSSSLIALPDGAQLKVTATDTDSYTLDGVELFPVQPQPVDQAPLTPLPNIFAPPFSEPPFKVDPKAYASDAMFPAAPAFGKALGQARDLNIAGLHFPAAQYNPRTDKLKVLTKVDVQVTFEGGTKTFSDAPASPWESAQNRFAGSLLNANVVQKYERPIVFAPCGEELLVITNPSTLASANTYASARRAAGFLTRVFQTGSVAVGTTATSIQTFIRSHLNHATCIRPSYVTIIGDDELVPTFTTGPSGIPSDNPYSTKDNTDELPDVAIGRLLGNTVAEIDAALAKIIHYETTPPTGPMLTRAVMAAQFQDTDAAGEVNDGQEDRTFVQFAETARTGLVARGVTVDRVYNDVPSTSPQKFNDGTSLPNALKKPTFAWNGDRDDISAAWNAGIFMAVHRDHGNSDAWIDPQFTTNDVNALTNDNDHLPVVLSINCASAQYDTDETSFVQQALVKPTGGAVGVFGDTRNSPTWHNSQLALGFLDALLPSVLSGEGPSTKQRMGNALTHGKLRLVGLSPPSGPGISGGDADTRAELYLWHYFGDPTMQMFGGGTAPIVFNPNVFTAVYKQLAVPPKPGDPPPYLVEVTFPSNPRLTGQPVSLLRNGEVIGKAIAGDGSVKIAADFNDAAPKPGELQIAVDADDAAPVRAPVAGVPPPPVPTTLTQACPAEAILFGGQLTGTMTITGNLAGAPIGSPVSVTFEGYDLVTNRTTVINATTGTGGNWTASLPITRPDQGHWRVSSAYAGAGVYQPSSAGPCEVFVHVS